MRHGSVTNEKREGKNVPKGGRKCRVHLSPLAGKSTSLAGLPQGGGKSVIIGDPRHDKTPALIKAMGRFVDGFGGSYVVAEDSGTSVADMRLMAAETRLLQLGNDGGQSALTAVTQYLAQHDRQNGGF